MRHDLQTTLKCEISNDWWEDCLGALLEEGTTHTSSRHRLNHDLVLTQVLHSDLRDVLGATVRLPFPPLLSSAATAPPLQEISNVHLLCQVEDWVDLSLGHENRLLQDNNSHNSSATNTKSCYKLFLTHGSHSFVGLLVLLTSSSDNHDPNHPKTASSLLFQAGSKVLIQSSSSKLKIRHGVWQLTLPGNLVVLGGSVAPLVQARTEALQKAQQLQGVGVDPTIRALIGNTHHHPTADDDEEHREGEGEGESSDLPPAAAPVAATVTRLPLVERLTPPPTHAGVAHATSTTRTSIVPSTAASTTIPIVATNAHVPLHHDDHHRGVHQQQQLRQITTSTVARQSSPVPSTTSTETTTRSLNPYASAISNTSMTSPATTFTTQSANPRSTTMGYQHNNPYSASSATITTTTHNSSPSSTTVAAVRTAPPIHNNTAPVPFSLPQQEQQKHRRPQPQSAPPTTFTNPYASTSVSSTTTSTTAPTASTTTIATSPQRIAYADLYQLLLLHLSEPLSISSHMSWLVEMKQWGANIHFNIGKHNSTAMDQHHASNNNHNNDNTIHKSKKKKKKEYVLEMHALFGVSPHQVVACQLPSRFVEPYFSVSPSALRALTRTDKAASHKITKEGGEEVKEVYFTPMRLWKAQLAVVGAGASYNNNNSNKDHSLTDVANPILTLEPVER